MIRGLLVVVGLASACDRPSERAPVPPAASTEAECADTVETAPPADAGALNDEAWCRAISRGHSCAEVEPALARLRGDVDRYVRDQVEQLSLSMMAQDESLSPEARAHACAELRAHAYPSESGMAFVPAACVTR